LAAALLFLGFLAPRAAHAQSTPPFFAAGATAFTPEIGVVNSGVVNDVQAAVSADRKYVTLNMRASNSTLLALQEFSFQKGGPALGFVGSGGNDIGVEGDAVIRAGGRMSKSATDDGVSDGRPEFHSLLDRTGMYRVDVPQTR